MKTAFLVFFIIPLILAVQPVWAQSSESLPAEQRLIEVTLGSHGNAHARHVIAPSEFQTEFVLISGGDVSDISITDEAGRPQLVASDGRIVTVMPSDSHSIVTYNLKDVATLSDGMWTVDFRYLATTTFLFPDDVDLVFINDKPLYFENSEGFNCHGCQLTLKYALDEPKNLTPVSWEGQEFLVEVRTFAEIEDFEFDQPMKEIRLSSDWNSQFVTFVIPQELLWGPYAVFLDDKKIPFNDYISNGTHVWVNMQPDSSGVITIVGTTVVPEFSAVVPLAAAGFLAAMAVPLTIRRMPTLR